MAAAVAPAKNGQSFMNHIGKCGWILWFVQCGMLPFMPTHFRQPFTSGQAVPLAWALRPSDICSCFVLI
jgi:hypothetical protein